VLPAPPLPKAVARLAAGAPYPIASGVILYSASRVVQDGNRVYELEDIYAVPATPGAQAEMVANNAQQPALSPDRQTLAFYSQQSDKLGIGGYDVNTGQRLRFSRFIEDSQPRWSPTGDRIVFASNRQGDRRWRIYITPAVDKVNPSDMDYTELDFGKDPDWHPSQELLIACPVGAGHRRGAAVAGGPGRRIRSGARRHSWPGIWADRGDVDPRHPAWDAGWPRPVLGGLSGRCGRRPPLIIRCRAESLPKISGSRLDSM
jgi:hypothetical protein